MRAQTYLKSANPAPPAASQTIADLTLERLRALGLEPRTYGLKGQAGERPSEDGTSSCTKCPDGSPPGSTDVQQIPSDLALVIDVWPTLPDAIKAGILAMIDACVGSD
jgi:hypothetical protein